ILIAATNHESLLDAAVWRRFTYRLALELPDFDQRLQMWIDFLSPLIIPERDLAILADLSEGFSGSDICDICIRLRREIAATGASLELKDIFPVLLNLAIGGDVDKRFASTLLKLQESDLIHAL